MDRPLCLFILSQWGFGGCEKELELDMALLNQIGLPRPYAFHVDKKGRLCRLSAAVVRGRI